MAGSGGNDAGSGDVLIDERVSVGITGREAGIRWQRNADGHAYHGDRKRRTVKRPAVTYASRNAARAGQSAARHRSGAKALISRLIARSRDG
jgi:hypothetical protein